MKISFEAPIYVDKNTGMRYVKARELTKNDIINLAKRVKEQEKKKLTQSMKKLTI